MKEDSLYSELGLEKGASQEEIKKAYRKLARELHPDKNKDNKKAEERFKKISAAYAVLGDEKKRRIYDQYGIDGLRDGFDPEIWKKYGTRSYQPQETREEYEYENFGGFNGFGSMEDIFEGLFGKRNNKRKETETNRVTKGNDLEARAEIELIDAILGREIEINLKNEDENRKLKVKIPQGIEDGKKIRLRGQGQRNRWGNGDLIIEVKIREDKNYERKGNDLVAQEYITIREAYKGTKKEIETPWGKINIRIPKGTQSGTKMRIRGKGIRQGEQRGNLYVVVNIKIPKTENEILDKAIEEIEKYY